MKFEPILLGAELRGSNRTATAIFKIPIFGAYIASFLYVVAPPIVIGSGFVALAKAVGMSEATAATCALILMAGYLVFWERCLHRWNISFTLILLFFIRIPARILYYCFSTAIALWVIFDLS